MRTWIPAPRRRGVPEFVDRASTKGLSPTRSVADLCEHVRPLGSIRDALRPYFALGESVPGPYLHRWNLEPGLRDAEEHLIATGQLPATGVRLIGTRLPT